ncbi:MAG: T9SS type B sorting domain-containing protein [Bacteroidetes bacterium]|nr:T9SS type B sorting domain-containing protein [Bacteroidota bacterium]
MIFRRKNKISFLACCLLLMSFMDIYPQRYAYLGCSWENFIDIRQYPPIFEGKMNDPQANGNSSTATICDSLGNMQLVAGHHRVFNKYKNRINDSDLILSNLSHLKSSIMLPTKRDGIYYYFYIIPYGDNPEYKRPGLAYAEIDVNANGGLAAITDTLQFYRTDSLEIMNIIAVPHQNQGEYWIIAENHADKKFYAWHFNGYGVQAPVISSIGGIIYLANYKSFYNYAYCYSNTTQSLFHVINSFSTDSIVIKQLKFDNLSGQLKLRSEYNLQQLEYKKSGNVKYDLFAETTEFDTILYLALSYFGNVTDSSQLLQFHFDQNMNIKDCNRFDISYDIRGLRYVFDGKLYFLSGRRVTVVKDEYALSVIREPGKWSQACDLQEWAFPINYQGGNLIFSNIVHEDLKIRFTSFMECMDTVIFENQSDSVNFSSFTWLFPNGDSLVNYHAKYSFRQSGKHLVRLKGTTPGGYIAWRIDTIDYLKPPIASFYSDTTTGCQWLAYQFYDSSFKDTVNKSIGESWLWDFGDGSTDTVQNPAHVYTETGKYTIKLIYSNGFCTDTIEKQQAVEIIAAPRPGFALSQSNYCSPYALQIADTSFGQVQKWYYSFGDGSDTSVKNPAHVYQLPGNYKIIQFLTGSTGCITKDSALLHLTKGFSGHEIPNALTATVPGNESILLNWESLPEAYSYDVFKSLNDTDYIKLLNQQDTFLLDVKTDPTQQVYAYKIAALDSCKRSTLNSLKMKNILLTGETHHNEYSILYWTPYEEYQNGVDEYRLQYKTESGQFAGVSSTSATDFRDSRFFDGKTQLEKCYRIVGVEKKGNLQQSISNILCLDYEAVLWVPTAFTPNGDGLNDSFLVQGIRILDFYVQIYNRWGEKVYESYDAAECWDGSFRGNACPAGGYTYLVKAVGNDNNDISITGSLHLIR